MSARIIAAVLRRLGGDPDDGFILLESMIAIACITVIMGAVGAEYVNGIASSNHARLDAVATQIASSQMEQIEALQPSDLTTGRGSTAVDAERTAIAQFTSVGVTTLEAYDATAASSATGTNLPTYAATSTVGSNTFYAYRYFECMSTPATAGSCVTLPSTTSVSANNIRAIVTVAWQQAGCPTATVATSTASITGKFCDYSTASIINDDDDLTFDLNQPLPAAPVVGNPAALTVANGDIVSYQMLSTAGVPPLTWAITSGTLPSGLSMSTTGLISGTVTATTAPSTVTSTFAVTDAFLRTATQTITWTIEPALTIAKVPDQASNRGQVITPVALTASGGAGSGYTFSDPGSTLPPGLTLSNGGTITGTPTTAKTYPVTLQVTDGQACPACAAAPRTTTVSFNWTVSYAPLAISQPSAQTATVNTALTSAKQVAMSATGGDGTYVWTISGQPTGLTISSATGVISGTPTATGTFSTTVTVSDPTAGVAAKSTTFNWTIVAKPTVTTPAGQRNAVGGTVNLAVASTCPDTPCTYALSGAPTNLAIDSTGKITGTVGGSANTYSNVLVTVTDSAGATATTTAFSWTVVAAPTIGSPGTKSVTEGRAQSVALSYSCPFGTCVISESGTTVPGLGLTVAASSTADNTASTSLTVATGSGTVYVTGTVANSAVTGSATSQAYRPVFTITTSDSATASSAVTTWTAFVQPTVTAPATQNKLTGSAVSLSVGSSCANAPCTFALSGAPSGVTINASTGALTGTITSGALNFPSATVTITDADGSTATSSFAWIISNPISLTSTVNNAGVTKDGVTGNFDGGNNSFSAAGLAAVGVTSGGSVAFAGQQFVWPAAAGTGSNDNIVANGQTVTVGGSGTTLGFLLAAANGTTPAKSGTIKYSDGTTQTYSIGSPSWAAATTTSTVATAATFERAGASQTQNVSIYWTAVPIAYPSKTITSVVLPVVSNGVASGVNSLHIFSMSLTGAAPLAASLDNRGVTSATTYSAGNFDGSGNSYSSAALTSAGVSSGGSVTTNGTTFTWPATAGTATDNLLANGQTISYTGTGTTLGFLVSSSYAATSGTGTVTYTDGTQTTFTLSAPLWTTSTSAAITTTTYNTSSASDTTGSRYVFYQGVTVTSGKTIATIQLPLVNDSVGATSAAMHVFAIGIK